MLNCCLDQRGNNARIARENGRGKGLQIKRESVLENRDLVADDAMLFCPRERFGMGGIQNLWKTIKNLLHAFNRINYCLTFIKVILVCFYSYNI